MPITPDGLRVLENAAVAYDGWIAARRELDALGPKLAWKTIQGRDYLYASYGSSGSKSLGARSPETEALAAADARRRGELESRVATTSERLAVIASEYRAHRLPRVHPMIGAICREADLRGILGSSLLIVGTNAMPVYEIEAQDRFAHGLDSTEDADFAWVRTGHLSLAGDGDGTLRMPFYSLLKAVDSTFTVNLEREFQARNAAQYEVELLVSPSAATTYPPTEPLRPIPLPEQEWLHRGRAVDHVLFDQKNLPARLVVPDPRWMALHKLWLADKPGRNPRKTAKDREQGQRLAAAVVRMMPGFPVDAAFRAEVPEELQRYLEAFDRK